MSEELNQKLERIIRLSNQIIEELSSEFDLTSEGESHEESNKLVTLNLERDKLIQETFNEDQSSHYENHLPLINQVVTLDNQLVETAEKNKQALKNGLLKMKKNQKAANTYKKY